MSSFSADRLHADRAAVALPAEIDVTNAGQLQDELNAALDCGATTVVVDMSRTTFCDSAGSRVLLRAHTRAGGMKTDLRLVIAGQAVRRVFEISGTDQIMHIYASLDAAQSGFAGAALPLGRVDAADL
jgi:anti-sigma B factor antagonist